jgi:hypothetical protein
MKKAALTVSFVCGIFILLVAAVPFVELAWANWALPPENVVITIHSPQNMTYNVNEISLSFTVERNLWERTSYVLDGAEQVIIEATTNSSVPVQDPSGLNYKSWTGQFNAVLSGLSEGIHTLTIREYVVYDWEPIHVVSSANVSFIVNTHSTLNVTISPISPLPSSTVIAAPNFSPSISPNPSPTSSPTHSLPASPSPSDQQPASSPEPTNQTTTSTTMDLYVVVGVIVGAEHIDSWSGRVQAQST